MSTSARSRFILLAILTIALALRLVHWWAVRDEPFFAQLAMDSQEYDRWAQEIVGGAWLGSQIFFQAPLYPYLLAAVYAVAGRSIDAIYLLQIAAAIAGIWALYRAAREMADERAGLVAAGLAAVYGPFLFYDVQLLKESLAVTVTCFLLWALAAARTRGGTGGWLAAGVLLGVLALLRENALLLVPFLLPFAWSRERRLAGLLRGGGALVAGLALALAPVALRNGLVGGDFLPTTFQGGVNFWIGNNPDADGTYQPIVPGKQIPALERQEPVRVAEQELGRPLTPAEVSSHWLGKALGWAAGHPGAFLRLQLRKLVLFWSWYEWPDAVDYYWTQGLSPVYRLPLVEFGMVSLLALAGLWMVRRRPGPFAPALLFALGWMLSTAIFFLFSRYRLPVVPALLPLAAVPLVRLGEAWRERRRGWRTGLALAAVAFLFLPYLVWFEPRMDLVHYNLGRLAEERGDPAAAHEHYKAAFILDPRSFLACMNLGNLAARRRDWPTALRFYQRAEAIEPRSDDVASNVGGVWLALGELAQAEESLDRALVLNPRNLSALHNKSLLRAQSGDLDGARELNRRLLDNDPQNPAGLRLRERLDIEAPPEGREGPPEGRSSAGEKETPSGGLAEAWSPKARASGFHGSGFADQRRARRLPVSTMAPPAQLGPSGYPCIDSPATAREEAIMLTKVQKWGNSQGVRVPWRLLEEVKIAVGDEVDVTVQDGRIVVAPSRRIRGKYRLEDLLAQMPEGYEPAEEAWGAPVGREDW